MISKLLLAVFVSAFSSQVTATVEREENVYVLGDSTFHDFVKSNDYVLAEFYAPWCGHCKSLAPEYAKAATQLEADGKEVKLAKVDATEHADIAKEFEVRGYPTLKWFYKGVPTEYSGGRTADEILNWVSKKSGPAAEKVTSSAQLADLKKQKDVFVLVTHVADGSDALGKVMAIASSNMDNADFYYTDSAEIQTELGVSSSTFVLLKQFDDKRADLAFTEDLAAVTAFITANYLPYVVEFGPETQKKIFGGNIQTHALLFASLTSESSKATQECYNTIAKKFRENNVQVMMVSVDIEKADNKGVVDYFKLTDTSVPNLRVIKMGGDMVKFAPESPITCDTIEPFINSVLDGSAKPHLMSEDVPSDWDAKPVKVLVGKNFESVALDSAKFVLVEFYAPWCGHCKKLEPIYDQLGEHYARFPEVVIAKMDSTANEVAQISIKGFPTLKGFGKGDNKVIEYSAERDLENLIKFVDEHAGIDSGAPKVAADEESKEEL